MKGPTEIRCKRAYAAPAKADGYRVLVDGIWPRGVSREALAVEKWHKALAPSPALRRWFGHDPRLWAAFYQKYHRELDGQSEAINELLEACNGRPLTLVYAARDTEHNNAVALKMYLERR